MSDQNQQDARYRECLLSPIRSSANYAPKFGGKKGLDLQGFLTLYGADPLYHWMGFDNPMLFTAHRAAGGMTSIYRQLGIGVEHLFRRILMDTYALSEQEANWYYDYIKDNGKVAKRNLDGRLDFNLIRKQGNDSATRVVDWVNQAKSILGININLVGVVFEVREGYKSKDSKRQNADLDNLSRALKNGYLMTTCLMSNQMDMQVKNRYQNNGMCVLSGNIDSSDPHESTYAFFNQVVGYDLVAFFERNAPILRKETSNVLQTLLSEGHHG